MKVTKTQTTDSETTAIIDLFEGRKLPASVKQDIQDQVGQFLVEQTMISVSEEKSPVKGEGWKKTLSKEYAKIKQKEVGNKLANMEFTGETLGELTFEPTKEGIKIGVIGERAPAADGHNNLSGKSSLPRRRYIPDEGQEYKGPITKEIDRIIADSIASSPLLKNSLFKDVKTKKSLYASLRNLLGDNLSNSELSLAVYRNEDLLDSLKELGLLDLL